MVNNGELTLWIEGLRQRFGSYTAISDRLDMTQSGFLRGVKRGTLSVENLLTLAQLADESPSRILRLAGKGTVADLIERLYGDDTRALTRSQREMLDLWDIVRTDVALRDALLYLMKHYAAQVRRSSLPGRPPRDTAPASLLPPGSQASSAARPRRRRA